MDRQGLFIGLVTLDLAYLVDALPDPNHKMLAKEMTLAAGGPATNAAVTFRYLGNRSTVIGNVGHHPATQLIRADLDQCQVELVDTAAELMAPPVISSILVTQSTGDRTVVYTPRPAPEPAEAPTLLPSLQQSAFDIVLIDGHEMALGAIAAQQARSKRIPVVVDGGSWKPGFERVLAFTDYIICSDDFFPPGCGSSADVMAYLRSLQIPYIAITRGAKPILFTTPEDCGEVSVPQIHPVDTLGAGDVFHGAFCDAILRMDFREALGEAGAIASRSCLSFGTRQWMQ